MSLLRYGSLLLRSRSSTLVATIRTHWNKDYKPLPFPKTQEQREAAAAKYGLHPAEYRPLPDDGSCLGDYPDLPLSSGDSRDPYYPWDYPELRWNYNQTMHEHFDMYTEDRVDICVKLNPSLRTMILQFLGAMLFWGVAFYGCNNRLMQFQATCPKQMPQPGVIHYTFELEDE